MSLLILLGTASLRPPVGDLDSSRPLRHEPGLFGVFTALGTVGFYAYVPAFLHCLQRQSIGRAVWNLVVSRPAFSLVRLGAGLAVTWFLTGPIAA